MLHLLLTSLPSWAHDADPALVCPGEAVPGQACGEEVLVRGARPEVTGERPHAVSVVPLGARAPASGELADALGAVPGVTVRRMGAAGDFAGISVRGGSPRHVELQLDGVPVSPEGAGAGDLSELPAGLFERAELHRGAAALGTGSLAPGGVLDLRLAERAGPWASGWASLGSFGALRLGAAADEALARGRLGLGAELLTGDGAFPFVDDRGTRYTLDDDLALRRENNERTQLTAHARWRGAGPRLALHVLAREQGVPGPMGRPTPSVRWQAQRAHASLVGERAGAAGRAGATAWALGRREVLLDPNRELGRSGQRFDTQIAQAAARFEAATSLSPALGAQAHAELRAESSARAVDGVPDPSFARGLARAGGHASWAPAEGRLRVEGGATALVVRATGWGEAKPEPSTILAGAPALGATLRLSPALGLRASAGRSVRPPDLGELFGDQGLVSGRPTLRPERVTQADLGLVAQGDGRAWAWSAELGGFGADTQDLIVWVQNAQREVFPVNLDSARVVGAEAALRLDGPRLRLTAAGTWNHSVNRSLEAAYAGNRLPRVPLGEAHLRAVAPVGPVELELAGRFLGGVYEDATNWHLQPARRLIDAGLRLELAEGWVLSAEARNLGGVQQGVVPRNPLNPEDLSVISRPLTDYAGYPVVGRAFTVGLRWTLGEGT